MAESFFLDPDDAKSMGNLDYMRTARKVKKSFPTTTAWGSGFEQEVETSAIKNSSNGSGSIADAKPSEVMPEVAQRRRAAADLDMFRNMAKDIRKG